MTDSSQPTPASPATPTGPAPTTNPEASPPASTKTSKAEPSLINAEVKPEAKPEGAPEKYESFKLPEGYEANEPVLTEATGLFKDLGLSQAQAQRLVDFYAKVSSSAIDEGVKFFMEQQRSWRDEVKADPVIGGQKLGQVMGTINKAINSLGDATLISGFREAMNTTGVGNNPAFIRAFHQLALKLTEGGPVSGNPPAPAKPANAAAAMYPNLKSAG